LPVVAAASIRLATGGKPSPVVRKVETVGHFDAEVFARFHNSIELAKHRGDGDSESSDRRVVTRPLDVER
jgi:hypothetical protein